MLKIISGGQAGADLGGIFFAKKHNIENEINTHLNFRPVRGRSIPTGVKINYITNLDGIDGLKYRTKYNVKNSDISLIFIMRLLENTRGSKLTANYCVKLKKPYILIREYSNGKLECSYFNPVKFGINHKNFLTISEEKIKEMIDVVNIVNVAGERLWDEQKIVGLLERLLFWRKFADRI